MNYVGNAFEGFVVGAGSENVWDRDEGEGVGAKGEADDGGACE